MERRPISFGIYCVQSLQCQVHGPPRPGQSLNHLQTWSWVLNVLHSNSEMELKLNFSHCVTNFWKVVKECRAKQEACAEVGLQEQRNFWLDRVGHQAVLINVWGLHHHYNYFQKVTARFEIVQDYLGRCLKFNHVFNAWSCVQRILRAKEQFNILNIEQQRTKYDILVWFRCVIRVWNVVEKKTLFLR